MGPLGARDLFDLSEGCEDKGMAARALAILARAEPQSAHGHAGLPVGARDAKLMAVRARNFGGQVALVSRCPSCQTALELSVTAEDIGLNDPHADDQAVPQPCRIGSHELMLRPVTAGDLADLETLSSPKAIRQRLLERCVLSVDGLANAAVPEGIAGEVEEALERLDPMADITLAFVCPLCNAAWTEAFDVAAILWSDIQRHTGRLLGDVAELARIYHWSERDILAMPASRRRFYLEAAR